MAALVPAGAPVSVLADHGMSEAILEKLMEAGVGTVEKLGSMTPEELEAIPGIGPSTVEKILIAVNSYYAQFEPGGTTLEGPVEEVVVEESPAIEEVAGAVAEQSAAEVESSDAALAAAADEPVADDILQAAGEAPNTPEHARNGAEPEVAKVESDTIEDSEGAG